MDDQDRQNLTFDKIKAASDKIMEPPGPIAFVFPVRLEAAVRKLFEESPQAADIRIHLNIGVSTPNLYGAQLYFDQTQQVECLAFYDRETLRKYLNRENDPEGWFRHIQDQYLKVASAMKKE